MTSSDTNNLSITYKCQINKANFPGPEINPIYFNSYTTKTLQH